MEIGDTDIGAEAITVRPGARRIEDTLGPMPRVSLFGCDVDEPTLALPLSAEVPDRGGSGRYQLLGEIARGGMGAVLKGRDADLGRDLAVKVLLEAHRERPAMVRRFVEEAQIGGQLQHPGIVPVYELGVFDDRRPYFTMKLVRGQTLARLLDERPDSAHDRPRFLSVFEQVCQTVAYAHAHKVIHRDLKPSNVMVGAFGEVQVMDWGLAKVLSTGGADNDAMAMSATGTEAEFEPQVRTGRSGSGADASRAGSVMGTASYMAPEQARGEIERLDERADVFALGAILCEILTGRPPFVGQSYTETLELAAAGETSEALVRLDDSGADPELLGIARHCLAADPLARPRDAQEVARATTAYLAGVQERLHEAELAGIEAQARAVEERKRRRVVLGFSASLLTVLALGIAGVATQWRRAERHLAAANKANGDLKEANALEARARAQAVTRLDLAMAAVERYHEGVSAELILRQPGMQPLRSRLLGSALEFYTKLQRVLEAEQGASAGAELARAYERVGSLSGETGAKAAAAEAFAKALAIRERIAREQPGDVPARADVADVRAKLAKALDETDKLNEARDAYQRATGEYQALARDRPDAVYTAAAARTALRLAQLFRMKLGRVAEAEQSSARAVSDFEALARRRPGDARLAADLAEARAFRAALFRARGNPTEALSEMGRAVGDNERAARDLADDDSVQARLATAQINFGSMLAEAGRPEDALAAFRKAEAVYDKLVQRTPNLADYQAYLAHARTSQGWVLKQLKRYEPALERLRRALPVWERLARDHPEVAKYQGSLAALHTELGDTLRAAGRTNEALVELRLAADLQEQRIQARPNDAELRSDLVDSYATLASTQAAMARPAEAVAAYRRVLEVVEAHPAPLPSDFFNAGCASVRLAILGRDGRGPSDDAGRREASRRLDQAMGLLKRAADSGYRDPAVFRDDPDLAPLRPRADFHLLVMDLEMPGDPFAAPRN
jgi:serine/threonine-protein kinase